MAKLWILAAFCAAAFVQLTLAQEVTAAPDNVIHKLMKEVLNVLAEDGVLAKDDLQKVIEIRGSSSKPETIDDVKTILDDVAEKITPELSKPITEKLAEDQLNDKINKPEQATLENVTTELNKPVTEKSNEDQATGNTNVRIETIEEKRTTLERVTENIVPELQNPVTEKLDVDQVNDNIKTAMEFIQSMMNVPKENKEVKVETIDERQDIPTTIPENITPEFSELNENQLNEDIKIAREFYESLLEGAPGHKDEVDKTITVLNNLLKESDPKKKQDVFLSFEKNFSPEFQTFLKDNSARWLDGNLSMSSGFLGFLLDRPDVKFKSEIAALKVSADAAQATTASVNDKKKTLYKIFNPDNHELDLYLKQVSPN